MIFFCTSWSLRLDGRPLMIFARHRRTIAILTWRREARPKITVNPIARIKISGSVIIRVPASPAGRAGPSRPTSRRAPSPAVDSATGDRHVLVRQRRTQVEARGVQQQALLRAPFEEQRHRHTWRLSQQGEPDAGV